MSTITKNKKKIEKLGIKIDNIPRNYVTINLLPTASFNIRTPITFTMGNNDLDKILQFISELGLPGKRVAKALINAVMNLCNIDLDQIKNNFWVVGYTPEDIIKYAQDVMITTMKFHHIPIIPLEHLNKESLKLFINSVGGYNGVKRLFTDVIETTSDEFRRVQKAEDILNRDKIVSEVSNDVLGTVPLIRRYIRTQCLTCRHCKVDSMGYRKCYKPRPLPENMTIKEVNKIYPSARIYDCNLIMSKFIMHDVHTCSDFDSRLY